MNEANKLIRTARDNGYAQQRTWLTSHGFEFNESYAQWVVVAEFVTNNGGARDNFDNLCGLYGKAQGSDVRNTALHKLLDARLRRDFLQTNPTNDEAVIESYIIRQRNDNVVRKRHLKEIKKISRKIFGIWNSENKPANRWKGEGKGMTHQKQCIPSERSDIVKCETGKKEENQYIMTDGLSSNTTAGATNI